MKAGPLRVATVLATLVLPQALGFGLQLAEGFVPLRTAPTRVAFSWDMFAGEIERCDVHFGPPLLGVAQLHQLARPLEWDPIYNTVHGYQVGALDSCARHASVPTEVRLDCFTAEGESSHVFHCP